MKIAKKLSKSIIALAMCLLLATAALAAATVTYTATLEDDILCTNELGKTVTLTVKADQKVEMDAFTAQVKVPEGLKLVGITNTTLGFGEDNFLLENGMILWYSENAENVTNDLLAEISIKVPAGTPEGEYKIEFEIIDISRDWGMPWEDGTVVYATLTVDAHADGDDADHLCDACDGAVKGAECVFVPGEPVWSDNSTCTVTGTCACGKIVTAEATVTSEVTAGNCQSPMSTVYTAVFDVDWAEEQIETVIGEIDADTHIGEEKTEYFDRENGQHTVKVYYPECGHVVDEYNEDHTYTDGECVCGAEEPEAPSDPEEPSDPAIPDGLKGDVNLDGEVDMDDVVALMQHVLNAEVITDATALANGEVTNDETVDMDDVVKLMQYVLNAIDSLD